MGSPSRELLMRLICWAASSDEKPMLAITCGKVWSWSARWTAPPRLVVTTPVKAAMAIPAAFTPTEMPPLMALPMLEAADAAALTAPAMPLPTSPPTPDRVDPIRPGMPPMAFCTLAGIFDHADDHVR